MSLEVYFENLNQLHDSYKVNALGNDQWKVQLIFILITHRAVCSLVPCNGIQLLTDNAALLTLLQVIHQS